MRTLLSVTQEYAGVRNKLTVEYTVRDEREQIFQESGLNVQSSQHCFPECNDAGGRFFDAAHDRPADGVPQTVLGGVGGND